MPESKKVPFSKVVKSQLPDYVKEEFPLVGEFLSQYYFGQEVQGGVLDLIENIDQYIKISELGEANLFKKGRYAKESVLATDISDTDTTIQTSRNLANNEFGTTGFPDTFGLLKIGNEIITYESKNSSNFFNCKRGFSGVSSYENNDDPENLVFSRTVAEPHKQGDKVQNLSILFLEEFLKKIKKQLAPGLDGKEFTPELSEQFLKQTKDLYGTRGTDESFNILFKALYNENVTIIKPKEFLISPSNANWRRTRDLIVEPLFGEPEDLLNKTLFQDEYENISEAYAPVSNVEKINVGILTNSYFKISIDGSFTQNFEGSEELLRGTFTPHAKTKVIGNVEGPVGRVSIGGTVIDVDSTVGFPTAGSFEISYSNGVVGVCSYRSKTLTQFLEVAYVKNPLIYDPRPTRGVEFPIDNGAVLEQNTFAYSTGIGSTGGTRVRIRSVLNELEIPNTSRQTVGAKAKIKSLGKMGTNFKQNNWFFNTAQSYDIESVILVDNVNKTYKINSKDDTLFRTGDFVFVTDVNNVRLPGKFVVTDVFNNRTFLIRGEGISNLSILKKVTRQISKVDSDLHKNLNDLTANIQNIYVDDDKVLVASHSLPSVSLYGTNLKLNPKTQKVVFSGEVAQNQEEIKITSGIDHNFFTGDAVYYTPEFNIVPVAPNVVSKQFLSGLFEDSNDFGEGIYFVKRVDTNTIKLAKSRSNLFNNIFEKVLTAFNTITLGPQTLEKFELKDKIITKQNLLREILPPVNDGNVYVTESGYNGIFINGVELKNYKSRDVCHYGAIENIEVVSGGSDFDVINPPVLVVSDQIGAGATGFCAVSGQFEELRVKDSGFDYIEQPIIKISGGNGVNAAAEAKLITIPYEVTFNATGITSVKPGIDTSSIGFSTFHKFRDAELVKYNTFGRQAVVGLDTGNNYFVAVQDPHTIKLHKSRTDALVGLNTVTFTDFGSGTHSFSSLNGKLILNSVVLTNKGSGYENKQRTCDPIGINTALNSVFIENHDYKSGELIQYTPDAGSSSVAIGGLVASTDYFVTKIDENNFKLSAVGVGQTIKEFNYRQGIYENLTDAGIGTHSFNYTPIKVEVIGAVGVSSLAGATFKAELQPIVRGRITSVHLSQNGVGYGSSEILNFERPCDVNVNTGRNAELTPVIHEGKIVDVFVGAAGTDYNTPPSISVTGIGTGAEITPILENGKLVSVKVNSKGIGYGSSTTTLRVNASGIGAKFSPSIQKWTVNQFKKNEKNITEDDVFIDVGLDQGKQLECSYVYAPRSLRQIVYATDSDGNTVFGKSDLLFLNGEETDTEYHSPIIGWAYDGNPIYGPYGYTEKSGGNIVQLKSGYKLDLKPNRPPTSNFPPQFFIEDFAWNNSNDEAVLDENNGRFGVTPEFPNGVYAYFATFDRIPTSDGIFKNFKQPAFPYVIGNTFKSKPNSFNYKTTSNQNDVDLNRTNWVRNTFPYALDKKNSGYDYLLQSNDFIEQDSVIKTVQKGSVDAVGILTGGQEYQVGDNVVFESEFQNNYPAQAKVSRVLGAGVTQIDSSITELSNVEFYPVGKSSRFLGIHTGPHNLINGATVIISGLTTTNTLLNSSFQIGISTGVLTLSDGIGTALVHNTGIATFIPVTGDLRLPIVKENDILQIGAGTTQEQVKVLGVDGVSSRLRVLRAYNATTSKPVGVGSIGAGHTATTRIENLERKFTVDAGFKGFSSKRLNKEIYFDPKEAIGLGTVSGVGIGTTISFSNPGAGISEVFIPTRAIYLPNHQLQTGDQVTYHTNSGLSIGIATNTDMAGTIGPVDDKLSDHNPLFVAALSQDLIGLSTVRVGLASVGISSIGDFVGTAETNKNTGLMYFVGIGTNTWHSFKLHNNPNILKGNLTKNTVQVSTSSTHGLLNFDTVFVNVNPGVTTTVNIKYNQYNRKLVTTGLGFTSGGITTTTSISGTPDSVNIPDHKLTTGQQVIYSGVGTATQVGGLDDQGTYYAYVTDRNTIKLTLNKYQTTTSSPKFVGLSTSGSGTIFPVNPPLNFYKNSTVIFDLSDSSLSYTQNSTKFPGFKFELYRDSNFNEKYETNGISDKFEIKQTGVIGVSGDAKITLTVNENTPHLLYYKLTPLNLNENPKVNKQIVIEDDVNLNNQLIFESSRYNGKFKVISTGSSTFTYDLGRIPEESIYVSNPAKIEYETISPFAFGPISKINLSEGGRGYTKLPGISTVKSKIGSGAILNTSTETIGKAVKTKIENIGFDYPADLTLRPDVRFPQILKIEPLTGFESIGVTSAGRGYNSAPSLVVLDGRTKEVVKDIDLRFLPTDPVVQVLKNTNDLSNTTPTIIPIGNPNGIRATNFTFNETNNQVAVTLKDAYSTSDTFPFTLGDKVLVENVSVGVGSTGQGYNSENYGYARFEIVAIASNLGGIGTVTYSLDGHLGVGQTPGRFDSVTSDGQLVPEGLFPKFDVKLKSNKFRSSDKVTDGISDGTVGDWLSDVKLLTVESSGDFKVGNILISPETGDKGLISESTIFPAQYKLDYFSIVENGWEYLTGFLNNEHQRIHDNDYYQNFSYSIKSKVPVQTWDDVVSRLNHTSGFKKFSELQIESTPDASISVGSTSRVTNLIQLDGIEDLNCENNFDMVSENFLSGSTQPFSNEITFNTQILTDFSESVSNRVLTIDDFSAEFNSNPRSTRFSDVARTRAINARLQKFITYVRDRTFTGERQLMMVTVLNDSGRGFSMVNQYGQVLSHIDLGSFDYRLDGSDGVLEFFPNKFAFNNYNVVTWSYNIDGIGIGTNTVVSSGTTTIGISTGSLSESLVSIAASNVLIAGGSSGDIVSITGIGATNRNNCRSAKVLVSVETDLGDVEFDELNIIHDGSDVAFETYGQLTIHSFDAASSAGDIGTFRPYLDGTVLKVEYFPDAGISTARVSSMIVGISSESSVGVGTYDMQNGSILVESKRIDATGVPEPVGVATFKNDFDAAYCVVQVSDLTNQYYEFKEVLIVDDFDGENPEEVYLTEYGNVVTKGGPVSGLGTISGRRTGVGNSLTEITFTPNQGIDVEVKTFMNALRIEPNTSLFPSERAIGGETFYDFDHTSISSGEGFYEGTENAVKRAFNLTHKEDPIFKREFDGSSSSVVNLTDKTITIPNHFFVSGQELTYNPATGVGTNSIGIGTTNVSGIGNTNILPPTVFAIKMSEDKIKLAKSAEDALKRIAVPFELLSVGVTTQHFLTAKDANTKVLVAIDNQIQSPVAKTSTFTTLSKNLPITDDVVTFSGITSFFGGEYVQIDDEIMKIQSVGVGSTNVVKVLRNWLGTALTAHTAGVNITKIRGNYNIVENTLNFIEPPLGKNPISTSTAPPDSRDWIGITTSSSFQGRVFTRSGVVNGSDETYANNHLYDDISQRFTGFEKTFRLTAEGSNVGGISTENGVILINGIFQEPGNNANYSIIEESVGVSSIRFTGTASSVTYDVNNANIPVGGVIVSVGSSHGFNYQPLVSAGGTAVVSAAGTISSIAIGNSGSGYRSGIQTVNVSIQRENLSGSNIVAIGTAQVTGGHITGIAITDTRVFYAPRDISNVGYSSISGISTITTSTAHGLSVGNEVVLSGIAFTCDYAPAVGVQSAIYNNVTGILTVTTSGAHGLSTTGKNSDVLLTGLGFTCALGVGIHTYPRTTDPIFCGAKVIGVASATQFTVNAGVTTVPTTYHSGGSAQPVLIAPRANNNSESKQDPAFDGSTVIRVLNSTDFEVNTGISTRAHNYARCGKVNQLLKVLIDDPLSYDDIDLEYSSTSPSTGGSSARASIVVGQGSSVIDFKLTNTGFGYNVGHILKVPFGGTTGIPTNTSYTDTTDEFRLTIESTDNDVFTGWSLGVLDVLDDFSNLFDGVRKTFPITKNGDSLSIQSKAGSLVSVQDCLLIFINDILQVPSESYFFNGGSNITFEEAPKGSNPDGSYEGDSMKFIFYKGTGGVDVVDVDVIDTVKKGDNLTLTADSRLKQNPLDIPQNEFLNQDPRTVTDIVSSSSVNTRPYFGPGLTSNSRMLRPVVWCRQMEDIFVSGKRVAKDRELYEPRIHPNGYLTQPVGVGSTVVYVDNVRPFFNPANENKVNTDFQKAVTLKSEITRVGAAATAVINDDTSEVSSVVISDGGSGYITAPEVSIESPTGLGATFRATATASITAGIVTSITVSFGGTSTSGTGYTSANPPLVLISPPTTPSVTENNSVVEYSGDSGVIVGFGTTTVGGQNRAVFQLFIPKNSPIRNDDITQPAIGTSAISGIQTGDYFVVRNSSVGIGSTTFATARIDGTQIGITTHFIPNTENGNVSTGETYVGNNLDCVYQVLTYHDTKTFVTGHGYAGVTTVVREVSARVTGIGTVKFDSTDISFDAGSITFDAGGGQVFGGGISTSYLNYPAPASGVVGPEYFFGDYSWGKIVLNDRVSATNSFNSFNDKGAVGIITGDQVIRTSKMKFKNYAT